MKTLYSKEHTEELVERIKRLTPGHGAQWGKMNVGQMLSHCSATMEVVRDRQKISRAFIGYLIGGMMKKSFYNDKPFPQNGPTHRSFIRTGEHQLEQEREALIAHLRAFNEEGPEKCTRQPHAFFGRMTPGQWASGMYKHTDHHLRQFGV
jgi:hypothetical protein